MSEQPNVDFEKADGLPSGWIAVELRQVCRLINGDRGPNYPTKRHYVEAGIPFINAGHLVGERVDLSDMNFISDERYDLLRNGKVKDGDVLFCLRGSLGKAALVRGLDRGAIASSLVILRCCDATMPNYVLYFVVGPRGKALIKQYDNGSAQPNLAAKSVGTFTLPVAPLPEQHRIVEEIEKQFTRLDVAVSTLEGVREKLKAARASVLKAAVEGRLVPTEAELARREGRPYEDASKLLERILEERERKHEEAQAGAKRKKKYKPPVETDVAGLPEPPEGWVWASLDALADVVGGVTKNKKLTDGREVPYLRVANVQRGWLDLSEVKSIFAKEDKIEKLRLVPGDILLNEGGDRDKLGRGWIWEGQLDECIHQNHVFRARVFGDEMMPKYVSHYANGVGQSYFVGSGKQTTNLASISLTNMRGLPVAVPPAAEQKRIVAEVERRLSVLDALDAAVEKNLERCTGLRQSILKRAFEGKLVPQDPNDESAQELLERIQGGTSA